MVDSLGNALTPGQEAFFRYSKARDASGNLLVCYHGTDRGGFTTFHKGAIQHGIMGSPGIFFTSNPDVARTYTDTSREPDSPGGNSIYQCYLNITNPLEVECGGRRAFDCQVEIGDRVYYHIDDICEYASSHGYDGVIARNVVDDMGYGYRDKGHVGDDLVVFNPGQVKLISNTNPTTSTNITEELLLEKTRQELIDKSKSGADYSSSNQQRGRNRWERRKYSQVANSVRDYNSIDMDAFWKGDILEFGIRVRGETDDYVVTVLFEGILAELRREVAGNHNKLEFKCVLRALLKVFNTGDVYISCSCPDWKYRMAYFATKNRYNSGTPEVRPSDITNPGDTKGAGCKHSLLVISNLDWMMKVASVINNYVKWCRQNMERNYAQYIFPQVYGVPYNRAVQMSLFDDPNDNGLLPSDQGTIGKAIERGMQGKDARGRWTSGNPYRFSKSETQDAGEDNPNQLHLDLGFGDGKAKSPAPEGTPAGGTKEDGE